MLHCCRPLISSLLIDTMPQTHCHSIAPSNLCVCRHIMGLMEFLLLNINVKNRNVSPPPFFLSINIPIVKEDVWTDGHINTVVYY